MSETKESDVERFDDMMSGEIGELAVALGAAQAEFESIKAERTGQLGHRRYKYADLDAMLTEVRKVLPKHGLAVVQMTMDTDDPSIVWLATRLLHKSNQWVGSRLRMKANNATPQGIGSTITYARRYSIGTLLGLSVEDDDDGRMASQPARPATATKTRVGPKITEVTKQRIIKACQDLSWTPAVLGEKLKDRGIAKLADMWDGDAMQLATALEKKFLDAQAKETFS